MGRQGVHQNVRCTGFKLLSVQILIQNVRALLQIVDPAQSFVVGHLIALVDGEFVQNVILVLIVVRCCVADGLARLLPLELRQTEVMLLFLCLKLVVRITLCV